MAELYSSDPMVNARTYYDVLKQQQDDPGLDQRTCSSSVVGQERNASSSSSRGKHVNWSDDLYSIHHARLQGSSMASSSVSDVDMSSVTFEPGCSSQDQGGAPCSQEQSNAGDSVDQSLMELAAQTSRLLQQNRQTMKELEELRRATDKFLEEVMKNPGNERVAQMWASLKAQEKMNREDGGGTGSSSVPAQDQFASNSQSFAQ